MAVTSLQIEHDGLINRLQFITDQHDVGLHVGVYTCNENWVPTGDPALEGDKRSEEVFHRELRIKSIEKGHFVPEKSTNPEWTPGYIESIQSDEQEDNPPI